MKRIRQEKLLELISKYEIDTQDELIERLRESGFEVTQATVSRDIRELNISKMTTGKGTYRYVLPKQTAPT
ncbi:MAG: arginine repressor, partial [Clostridia bacterium]|nr:arginine repressor [Clostridia bacterium]